MRLEIGLAVADTAPTTTSGKTGWATVSSALSIGHHVRLWRTTQVVSAWRAIAAAYLALVIAGLQPEPRLESDELR